MFNSSAIDTLPKIVQTGLMFGRQFPTGVPVPDIDHTDLLVMLGQFGVQGLALILCSSGQGPAVQDAHRRLGAPGFGYDQAVFRRSVSQRSLPLLRIGAEMARPIPGLSNRKRKSDRCFAA